MLSTFRNLRVCKLFDEVGNQGEFFDLSLAQSLLKQKYGEIHILVWSLTELPPEPSQWVPLYRPPVLQ